MVFFVIVLVSSDESTPDKRVLNHILSLNRKFKTLEYETNEQKAINKENKIAIETLKVALSENDEEIKSLKEIQEIQNEVIYQNENEIQALKELISLQKT